MSLKRDKNNKETENLVKDEQRNIENNSLHGKRAKTSSNSSNGSVQSISNNKKIKNNTYKLRVSFQKCSSFNNDLNQNSSFENNQRENSIKLNDNNPANRRKGELSKIDFNDPNSDVLDRIKIFFNKSKPDTIHTTLVTNEETSRFISKLTNNNERLNPLFYD